MGGRAQGRVANDIVGPPILSNGDKVGYGQELLSPTFTGGCSDDGNERLSGRIHQRHSSGIQRIKSSAASRFSRQPPQRSPLSGRRRSRRMEDAPEDSLVEEHTKVVHKLLAKSHNGTEVHYIVGNHDEVFRSWLDWELSFGGLIFAISGTTTAWAEVVSGDPRRPVR